MTPADLQYFGEYHECEVSGGKLRIAVDWGHAVGHDWQNWNPFKDLSISSCNFVTWCQQMGGGWAAITPFAQSQDFGLLADTSTEFFFDVAGFFT